MSDSILLGRGAAPCRLSLAMGNRHGLVAGATGTGKTVTLRVLAEGFSRAGVPVFLADIKGDLASLCEAGGENPAFAARAAELGIDDYQPQALPVEFWDVFGTQGLPLRTTISEVGPLLLARMLQLNETQEGVLRVVFQAADEEGLLLLDLKDLQAMLTYASEHAKELSARYGHVAPASIAAIQRGLLTLSQQGADQFFGEPALAISDLLRTDAAGQGVINILAADKLLASPRIYATMLLWLLSELFEELPEVGDPQQPKLVFFFDEAHLLFDDAPRVVVEKVEQVVRLIRSKGVGVYFVTQNPLDVPQGVLGQLGNRVQHALRAFTPQDQKAVRAAATTFRSDGSFDVEAAISQLAVGEALVSLLDGEAVPCPVERAKIAPPRSRLGTLPPEARAGRVQASPLAAQYRQAIDRQSAYEMLKERRADVAAAPTEKAPRSRRQTPLEAMINSAARSIGTQLGRQVLRGILGSLTGGSSRKR